MHVTMKGRKEHFKNISHIICIVLFFGIVPSGIRIGERDSSELLAPARLIDISAT